MKLKVLSIVTAALLSSTAFADVVMYGASPEICSNIAGEWTGNGTVKALWGAVTCKYKGKATLTAGTDSGHFGAAIELSKDTGSDWVCPEKVNQNLPGTCVNGAISLETTSAHFTGTLNNDATRVDNVKGTVKISGVTADVSDMYLVKK